MKLHQITFAVVGIFVCTQVASAAMSSTNYEIRWDTFSTGGSDTSSSATYQLRDTAGAGGATSSSTSYHVSDGYRAGIIDDIITFDLFIQNIDARTAATSLSGTTIGVSSTSGISTGDYVVLIQNTGTSQISAIGKVSSTGVSSVVVDRLQTAGTTPTIDGTNDYLYVMSGSSLGFGQMATSGFYSLTVGFEITADNDNGYVIQVFDDGNLRSGSNDIDDISDGEVTAGSEEYGASSSDTSLATTTFDTQDTAVTTTGQDIVTNSSFAFDDRSFVILKASVGSSTQPGDYAQTLTFIVSGNY